MKSSLVVSLPVVAAAILVACGGGSNTSATSPSSVTVNALTVTRASIFGAAGQTSQLTAKVTLPNQTTQDVTAAATWQSTNTGIATVSSGGLVTAVATGTATITATYQGDTGTLGVTVNIQSGSTTTFEGSVAGAGGQSGTFSFTVQTLVTDTASSAPGSGTRRIAPRAAFSVSGVVTLTQHQSVALTGSYDASTHTLTASGGGFSYTGAAAKGALSGTYTDPTGASGVFSGVNGSGIAIYCGEYAGNTTPQKGTFNTQVNAAGLASVTTFPIEGASGGSGHGTCLLGTVNSSGLLHLSEPLGSCGGDPNNSVTTADGVVSGGKVNGTYSSPKDNGTFKGVSCR